MAMEFKYWIAAFLAWTVLMSLSERAGLPVWVSNLIGVAGFLAVCAWKLQ